jgi:Cu-Zn family superoxide dismutase
MTRFVTAAAPALLALLLGACASPDKGHDHGAAAPAPAGGMGMMGGEGMGGPGGMGMMKGRVAVATLTPTQGNNVRGLIVFHQMGDGSLMAHAQITGLKPNGEHGFHIHDKGDCASADGTSAGGHFNPDGKPHGPQDAAHHAGDMPSLKADANGAVDLKFKLVGPTVSTGPASLVGRGVIVHANPDDFATQPTGNSGARVACGVIAGY